jgi:BASS family bile acid:Na+ symporter
MPQQAFGTLCFNILRTTMKAPQMLGRFESTNKMSTFLATSVTPLAIIASIVFGFLFPAVGLLWKNYIGLLLVLLMLFLYLRIDTGDVKNSFQDAKPLGWALLMTFVFMPLLALVGRVFFAPILLSGIVLAFSSPPAAATGFWARIFKGDVAFALILTAVASLLAVFIVPASMLLATGAISSFDPYPMILMLAELILIPAVIVLLLKKAVHIEWNRVTRHTAHVELGVVFLLIWGSIAPGIESVKENLLQFGLLNVFMFASLGLGFSISFLVGRRFGYRHAISAGIATCVKNAGLSLVIGLTIFGPSVIPPLIANLVAQNLLIVLLLTCFKSKLVK